jgi:hypothetical protein
LLFSKARIFSPFNFITLATRCWGVYLRTRNCEWIRIARTFYTYYVLMVSHYGISRWQFSVRDYNSSETERDRGQFLLCLPKFVMPDTITQVFQQSFISP